MKRLDVIVVGAGIGGLATALALSKDGHRITVIDAVKEFAEVGAGIRVPPNSSRLNLDWGVDLGSIKKETSLGNRFVDWHDNILLDSPFGDVQDRYGAPYYFIHRADLVNALLEAAKANTTNIKIVTESKVVEYDFDGPSVKTEAGTRYKGDLVISAEGIKSAARAAVNGAAIEPRDTGDVAYRILVPAGPLLEDPKTRHLVEQPWAVHWMGPEGHAVGYPLRAGEMYNIIIDITHGSDLGESVGTEVWRKKADNQELTERFKDWCYPVRKLCGMTGNYLKWKLAELETPLQRWVHPAGKVALLGDASHPMMPYMAQGAAQAIEDAATLRAALKKFDGEKIPEALRVYEKQRAPRSEYVARNTRVLQEWLHLYDGPAQEQRNELMTRDDPSNPIFWACTKRKDWLFGHDASQIYAEGDTMGTVPDLPPMPPLEASVYGKGNWIRNLVSTSSANATEQAKL